VASSQVGIGIADVARIDRDNILQATYWAMAEALAGLPALPSVALVDGNRTPKLPCPVRTIVDGDAKSLSIAAASIIAKVTRDRIMASLDEEFPCYGFASHKGYGTAAHLATLRQHGPCIHHRMSFKPVKALEQRGG
jgi:ribonuclease HII